MAVRFHSRVRWRFAMGIIGENLSEGTRTHHNPQWGNGDKPANPNNLAGAHIKKKKQERESGTVDWAARFQEDPRFAEMTTQPEMTPTAGHEEVMADFAALAERARSIAAHAHQQVTDVDHAEERARLLDADGKWGAALARDGSKYYWNKDTGETRWGDTGGATGRGAEAGAGDGDGGAVAAAGMEGAQGSGAGRTGVVLGDGDGEEAVDAAGTGRGGARDGARGEG